MSEEKKVYVLKKSDIQVTEVNMPLHLWRCPLCSRVISSVHRAKLIAAAKLHLERTHSLRVVVED